MDFRVIVLLSIALLLALATTGSESGITGERIETVSVGADDSGLLGSKRLPELFPVTDLTADNALFSFSPIPVNLASAELVATIDGVGPILSNKIVEYRKEKGGVLKPGDILDIKGIGPEKLKMIEKNLIFSSQ